MIVIHEKRIVARERWWPEGRAAYSDEIEERIGASALAVAGSEGSAAEADLLRFDRGVNLWQSR